MRWASVPSAKGGPASGGRAYLSGIGIDVVDLRRASRFIRSHRKALSRFLLPREYALFCASRDKTAAFAILFAAKEAASKALGIRITSPGELRQFRIERKGNTMSVKAGGTRVRLTAFWLPGAVGVLAFAASVR